MTTDIELAEILSRIHSEAPIGQKTLAIHLFGIIYATELERHDIQEIAELIGNPPLAETIRNGMGLSRMVKLDSAGLILVDELGIAEVSWDSAPPA